MSYPYLISKFTDPIFALFIGTTSAWLRIRREDREIYGRLTSAETWETLKRRVGNIKIRDWDLRDAWGRREKFGIVDP